MPLRRCLVPLFHITLASVLNMGLYLIVSNLWRAVLNDTESKVIQMLIYNILVPLLTCFGFALCLWFYTHIRCGRGEKKLLDDYKSRPYRGLRQDIPVALSRERAYLVWMVSVIAACTLLRGLDDLIVGENQKLLTHLTFPYMTMDLLAASFPVTVLGEALSAVADVAAYLLLVLLYRRRAWRHWSGGEGRGNRA